MIIKLPVAFAGSFAKLSDFDTYPELGQMVAYEFADAKSTNGLLTFPTVATDTIANGVLTISPTVQRQFDLQVTASSPVWTRVALVRRNTILTRYVFFESSTNGINALMLNNTLGYQFNNGTNYSGQLAINPTGLSEYCLVAYAYDGNKIYGSVNGAAWSDGVTIPAHTRPTSNVKLGNNEVAPKYDVAQIALWGRMLSNAELANLWQYSKGLKLNKGLL